jgi:integrase
MPSDLFTQVLKSLRDYKPNSSANTHRIYTYNIMRLLQDFKTEDAVNAFDDAEKVIKHIVDAPHTLSTKRNKFSAVIVYLQSLHKPKELIEKYSDAFDSVVGKLTRETVKMKKTEREADNWISKADLVKFLDDMKEELPKRLSSYTDLHKWQQYVTLYFHLHVAALRNDLADMALMTESEYKNSDKDETENYIVLGKKGAKGKAIIQQYKTKKTYGAYTIPLNEETNALFSKYYKGLQEYKKIHDIDNHWFIIYRDGSKITRNDYTKFMNDIFEPLGKKVSSSMIRKAVVSDAYDAEKIAKLAHDMGHSVSEAVNSYLKV